MNRIFLTISIASTLLAVSAFGQNYDRPYGDRDYARQDRAVFDQCTDTIVRQVDDIKRMVDEFSSFARMPKARPARDDLVDCVREVLFLMRVGRPASGCCAGTPDRACCRP